MAEFVGQDKDAIKVPETIPIRHQARPLGIIREAPPKLVRKRVNLAQPEYDDTETEPTTGRPTDDITTKQPWRSLGFGERQRAQGLGRCPCPEYEIAIRSGSIGWPSPSLSPHGDSDHRTYLQWSPLKSRV